MRRWMTLFGLGMVMSASGQTADEIRSKFPGEELAFSNFKQELRLFLKDDVPVAESRHEQELIILSDKNASLYSRQRIYHSGFSELKTLEAYTITPNGKKIKIGEQKTTSSAANGVFYDDSKETSFDFPSLTKDAVGHLEYTQYHKDAHLLNAFYLPSYMPMMNAVYTVIVPNEIQVKFAVKNDPKNVFSFSEEKRKKETVYRWTAKDMKGLEDYQDAPSRRYFDPHIIVYVASYEGANGKQNYLNSLNDLYQWNTSFTRELNNSPDVSLKKIVDSITANVTIPLEKAKRIYRWVQHNIKYVAFEDGLEGFRPRQAADVCHKRYGDCKDMSSIITQMLRMAGIKAYYTWIGTRSLPYDYSELPLPIVDNHMISVAEIDDQWYFLDGTNPYSTMDLPPYSIQGKEAMVSLGDKDYKVLRVPVADADRNLIIDSTFISFSANGITGTEKVDYYGYFGEEVYSGLMYRDEKEQKNFVNSRMGKASNKFILGDYKINKIDPAENRINITAAFDIQGYAKKAGDEYYINLNLEKLLEGQIIDTAKRRVPKESDYLYRIKQYHILEIPKDYAVSYKPEDFRFDNELVSLSIHYEVKNNTIIAAQELHRKKLMIYPPEFIEWNKALKAAQAQYKESVVLEKR